MGAVNDDGYSVFADEVMLMIRVTPVMVKLFIIMIKMTRFMSLEVRFGVALQVTEDTSYLRVVLPRLTPIPVRRSETFSTYTNNQVCCIRNAPFSMHKQNIVTRCNTYQPFIQSFMV